MLVPHGFQAGPTTVSAIVGFFHFALYLLHSIWYDCVCQVGNSANRKATFVGGSLRGLIEAYWQIFLGSGQFWPVPRSIGSRPL